MPAARPGSLSSSSSSPRETDPTSRVPLKLSGQELQADSYAVAHMNAIIHDMEVQIERGDTMINPKFKDGAGRIAIHDIVVANPMWNQDFNADIFENDPFDRFRTAGGVTTGKGDWAWLQHTLVLRLGNTLTKMRRNFCRRQGAMTSSGRYHARKSNAADGKKDKQIRQRISQTQH